MMIGPFLGKFSLGGSSESPDGSRKLRPLELRRPSMGSADLDEDCLISKGYV